MRGRSRGRHVRSDWTQALRRSLKGSPASGPDRERALADRRSQFRYAPTGVGIPSILQIPLAVALLMVVCLGTGACDEVLGSTYALMPASFLISFLLEAARAARASHAFSKASLTISASVMSWGSRGDVTIYPACTASPKSENDFPIAHSTQKRLHRALGSFCESPLCERPKRFVDAGICELPRFSFLAMSGAASCKS